jgi:glucose/arabinose dehydrogenase
MKPTGRSIAMTRSHPRLATVIVAAAVLFLAGCAAPPDSRPTRSPQSESPRPAPSARTDAAGELVPVGDPTTLATGLVTPWSVAFVDGTAFVSERDTGNILELSGGASRVVGTVPGVVPRGESGLLGIAVDSERRLYAYSTGADGNRIHRFDLTGTPGAFGLGAGETVLEGIPAASYHDGGRIAFGPDGMLYATTGDAGLRDAAQDLDSLAGKILRMTPDGAVPADNPFSGSFVYSFGHRNPQGLAWADDGTLFAAEFGQDTWDELNIIEAGGNYGWPAAEGIAGDPEFVDPVQQWTPDRASPSGIAVVGGTVFIANLRGQTLRAIPVADPTTSTDHFAGTYGRIRHAAEAPDGTLWMLTSNTDGYGDGPRDGDDRLLSVPLGER